MTDTAESIPEDKVSQKTEKPSIIDTSVTNSCKPITSIEDAKSPYASPLIPIKGLRHDENGELTKDAIQTILDGMKSLGVDPTKESTQTAILKEAKMSLCRVNAQYEFLVKSFVGSEAITDKDTLALLSEKNQAMKDILSVSRHIMDMSSTDNNSMVEGFLDISVDKNKKLREAFQAVAEMAGQRSADLQNGSVSPSEFRKRTFEVSQQQNNSVSAYLSLYGFMNVVAVGLLFYIITI